jgi:uncharacterized protein YabE (DUF348 family)
VAAGLLYLQLGKNVILVVDGEAETIHTFDANVGQLLELRGINLERGDVVLPSPSTSLADGMVVVVEREVEERADAPPSEGVWAVAGGSGVLVKELAAPEVALSTGTSVGPSRINAARVVVRGKARDIVTNATTVRELLSAMGITPDGNDRVSPPPRTPLPVAEPIRYREVEFRVKQVRTTIPFGTVTTTSGDLAPGEVRVVASGADGAKIRLLQVWVVDGKVRDRWVIDERVLRVAVPQRVLVGPPPASDALSSDAQHGSETGEASWYRPPWDGLTAAHPWLPFGTVVTVTNLDNGRSVTVVINDRGPFGGRAIDLSAAAFERIAPLGQGVADVRLVW